MEEQWQAERRMLRHLLTLHPDWTTPQLASCLGRSPSWIKKWRKRLREADPQDQQVLLGQSRARHTPPPAPDPLLVQRILELRDTPPEGLQRTPGPRAIAYYLPRHAEGIPPQVRLPRSSKPIWKILRQHGRIAPKRRPQPRSWEEREPLEEVQMDLKDASTVPADPGGEGKRQHVVEICNFVDAGTSIWLHAEISEDFHAETVLAAVVALLRRYGLPRMLTFDRDPRHVGSARGRDFPSALRRFLLCLGIQANVCPPHRPDRNAYVERFHRTLNQECLQVHRPTTLQEVREVTERYEPHYNDERPHQGRACGNVPPRVAFPLLPKLPPLPQMVNPDRWLSELDQQAFVRKVAHNGTVSLDSDLYAMPRHLVGQRVLLVVNAPERSLEIWHGSQCVKQLPIKGVYGTELPLERYVTLMLQEARSEERRASRARRSQHQLPLWA